MFLVLHRQHQQWMCIAEIIKLWSEHVCEHATNNDIHWRKRDSSLNKHIWMTIIIRRDRLARTWLAAAEINPCEPHTEQFPPKRGRQTKTAQENKFASFAKMLKIFGCPKYWEMCTEAILITSAEHLFDELVSVTVAYVHPGILIPQNCVQHPIHHTR